MAKIYIAVLLLLGHVIRTTQHERRHVSKQQTFEANGIDDVVSVTVKSCLPGSIRWKESKDEIFQIEATIHVSDIAEIEQFNIDFVQKNGFVQVLVTPATRENTTVALLQRRVSSGSCCRFVTSWVSWLCLVVCLSSTRGIWKTTVFCCIILVVSYTVNGDNRQPPKVSIVVTAPRRTKYQNIFLFINNGTITVPSGLSTNASFICSTSVASDNTGCPSCCHGHGVCGLDNRCHCHDDYSEDTYCGAKKTPVYTLYTNPGDARVAQTRLPNGQTFDIYAKRRRDGSIRTIDVLTMNDPQRHITISTRMDKRHRIQSIRSSAENMMKFRWKSDCEVNVAATTANKRHQANVEVNLCHSRRQQPHKKARYRTLKRRLRLGKPNKFMLSEDYDSERRRRDVTHSDHHHVVSHHVDIPITVKRCGIPDPEAEVYAVAELGQVNDTFNTHVTYSAVASNTPGMFYIKVPNKPASQAQDNTQVTCSSLSSAVAELCSVLTPTLGVKICGETKKAFRLVSGTSLTDIDDVVSTCTQGIASVIHYCDTVNFIPTAEVGQTNCSTLFNRTVDIYTEQPINITPVAIFADGHSVKGNSRSIQVTNGMLQYKDEVLILDDNRPNIEINGFSVIPDDPQPREKYKVRTEYVCATNTTTVNMRITGSDQYSNRASCHGFTECNCCTLHVAGASKLVVDHVAISVTDPVTGYNFTQKIVVVF